MIASQVVPLVLVARKPPAPGCGHPAVRSLCAAADVRSCRHAQLLGEGKSHSAQQRVPLAVLNHPAVIQPFPVCLGLSSCREDFTFWGLRSLLSPSRRKGSRRIALSLCSVLLCLQCKASCMCVAVGLNWLWFPNY